MTALLKQSVLSIYIPKQGNVPQGKFTYLEDKPCFVANMTGNKLFRNFNGYAISKRLLDKLPRGTKIIFNRVDLDTHYITNKTHLYKHGVQGFWGGHSQICLPLKQWETKPGTVKDSNEGLPVMDLESWGRLKVDPVQTTVNQTTPVNAPNKKYYSFRDLKEVYERKYA